MFITLDGKSQETLLEELDRLKGRLAEYEHPDGTEAPVTGSRDDAAELMSEVLNHMTEHILLMDPEHNILWANRATADLHGRTPAEIVGIKCHILRHGLIQPCHGCPVERSMRTGEPAHGDITSLDGRVQYVWAYPIHGDDGKIVRMLEVARDITVSHMVKDALEEAEQRFLSVVEHSPEVIIIIDRDGTIKYLNRGLRGKGPDELMDTSLFDTILLENPQEVNAVMVQVFDEGRPSTFKMKDPRLNGPVGAVAARMNPIFKDGKVMSAVAILHEPGRGRDDERGALDSFDTFRSLVMNAPFPIMIVDREAIVGFANLVDPDVPAEDVVGHSMFDYIATEDPEEVRDAIEEAFETGRPGRVKSICPASEGVTRTFESIISPFVEAGEVIAASIMAIDVTKEQEAMEALIESESRYRTLAEASFEGVVISEGGRILEVNQTMAEMSGYEVDELKGMDIVRLLTPESAQVVAKYLEEGYEAPYVIEGVRRDGSRVTAEVRGRDTPFDGRTVRVTTLRDLTHKRRQERAVKESEERYRLLAENVADVIFIMGTDLLFSYVSPSFSKLTGFTAEELMERGWQEMLTPDSLEAAMKLVGEGLTESLEASTEDGSSFVIDMEMYTKSGGTLWMEVNVSLLHEPDGEIAGILGVARDVTERRRIEDEIRESEARFRALADATFDGIIVHKEGKISEVNKGFAGMFGYEGDELMGMTPFDLVAPEDRERVKGLIRSDFCEVFNFIGIMKDGARIEVEAIGKSMPYKGQVARIAAVRDITSRRWAERALAVSEDRYRLLAENSADIIFTIDDNLDFTFVSPSFQKLTGFTVEELMSMGWANILSPGSYDIAMGMLADNLVELIGSKEAEGEDLIFEMEVRTKDGRPIWMEVNLSAQLNADGEFEGFQGVARDISKRKQTERRYLDAKQQAEFYLDVFSHDIININQGIMNYLEVMQQRLGLEGVEGNYIKNVLAQSWRISELITNVQLLTRLQEGRVKVGRVDPERMLRSVIEEIKMKYENRDVEVLLDVKGQDLTVKASSMLHDAFRNVIDNAVKFDRHVKTIVEVSVRPSHDGTMCSFEFCDRGPGIPDAMKRTVFRRLDRDKGDVRGTGLGLAVVREFVSRYGGKVRAEDRVRGEPGQGSRIVITLPIMDGGEA